MPKGVYDRTKSKPSSRIYTNHGWETPLGYQYKKVRGVNKAEHAIVAERVLGHPLPSHARIHHINEKPDDNTPSNLVICENNVYHLFLHVRLRAYRACGNVHWRKCVFCKQYDDAANLAFHKGMAQHHLSCRRIYRRQHDTSNSR